MHMDATKRIIAPATQSIMNLKQVLNLPGNRILNHSTKLWNFENVYYINDNNTKADLIVSKSISQSGSLVYFILLNAYKETI